MSILSQPLQWGNFGWTEQERSRIWSLIEEGADRFSDVTNTLLFAKIAAQQSCNPHFSQSGFALHSLMDGPLGILLFYGELHSAYPDAQWADSIQRYLNFITSLSKDDARPESLGLFGGQSGLLFVQNRILSGEKELGRLWSDLVPLYRLLCTEYTLPRMKPTALRYSLESGAIGICATLLSIAEDAQEKGTSLAEEQYHYVLKVVNHLLWVSNREGEKNVQSYIHWYLSSSLYQTSILFSREEIFGEPGMAQGVSGLLAIISLACTSTLDLDRKSLSDSLLRLCNALGYTRGDVLFSPVQSSEISWGGLAGAVRALWLAACALDDATLRALALERLAQVRAYVRSCSVHPSSSLCHGLAGILLILCRFAQETGDSEICEDVRFLTSVLLDIFEPDRPFGFRAKEANVIRTDSPWLRDGAVGVFIALLATVTPIEPSWDRLLLLS